MKILPTLLYPDFQEFSARFYECVELGGEVHIDFADGEFVPNQLPTIEKVSTLSGDINIEAHLMVQKPQAWVESAISDERFKIIIVHAEADINIAEVSQLVRQSGRKFGLAIKPETTVEDILAYAEMVDQLLILLVNPGFNGSPFLPEMIDKFKQLRQLHPNLELEADGGMNPHTLPLVQKAGASRAAIGTFLHGKSLQNGMGQLAQILSGEHT